MIISQQEAKALVTTNPMTPLLGGTVGYYISLLVNCTLVRLLGHDLLETQNALVSSSQNREMTLNIVDPGTYGFPIFSLPLVEELAVFFHSSRGIMRGTNSQQT